MVKFHRGRAAVTSCGLQTPHKGPIATGSIWNWEGGSLGMLEAGKPVKTIGLCPRERRVRTRLLYFGARHCMYLHLCIRACMIYLFARCVCVFGCNPTHEKSARACAMFRGSQFYLYSSWQPANVFRILHSPRELFHMCQELARLRDIAILKRLLVNLRAPRVR